MRVTSREDSIAIAEACAKNRWLAGQGLRLSDTADPNEAADFVSGRKGAGEGVVIGSVALVQQVDRGDEWLALKRDGSKWAAFDSVSLAWASDDRARFAMLIGSMRGATPEQCRRLQYRPLSDRSEPARAAAGRGGEARPLLGEAR